jgi:hypothetical protein
LTLLEIQNNAKSSLSMKLACWPKVIHCDIISNHFIWKRCTQLSWVVLYSLRLCLVRYHNKPYNYIRILLFHYQIQSNPTPSWHGSLKNLCKEKKFIPWFVPKVQSSQSTTTPPSTTKIFSVNMNILCWGFICF